MRGNGFRKHAVVAALVFAFAVFAVFTGAGKAQAAASLNKTKLQLYTGETYKLKVSGTKKTVKWKTSKKSVATVKKGTITAKQAGKTTITATVGKKKLKCKVTVLPTYKINGKTAKSYTLKMKTGDSRTLRIYFPFVGSHISCVVRNSHVANSKWGARWIDEKNTTLVVKAYQPGQAEITLTNNKNADTVLIKVTVTD